MSGPLFFHPRGDAVLLRSHQSRIVVLLASLFLLFTNCTKKSDKKEFWIYTSIYKDVINQMQPRLEAKFPDVEFMWFQSGSENVAARLNAELSTGKPLADLVMTSDIFWYLEMKNGGHLLLYKSELAKKLPANFRDPDGAYALARIPTAVIAYNSRLFSDEKPPQSFEELKDPKWKGKISMGSPLESGTSMTVVTQLVHKKGWAYFKALRKNDILSAGGNSSVIQRMETGERPIGIVLLENILDAQRRGSPIMPVYPTDGNILVPSPIAILSTTKDPELSKQIYDYFLGKTMQEEILAGRMYAPLLPKKAPNGAIPFEEIQRNSFPWNDKLLHELYGQRNEIKKKFMEIVLH